MIDSVVNVLNCPLCNSDLRILNENYRQCSECHLAVSKHPALEYDDSYYYGIDTRDKRLIARAKILFKNTEKFIRRGNNVLDFGCNVGLFVDLCNRKLIKTDGLDISKRNIRICREYYSNRGQFFLPDEIKSKYDCVTAFDVIEHFEDLNDFMRKTVNCLSSDGLLVITTPNINSAWIDLFGFGWHGFGIPQYHRYILSMKALESLAELHQMKIHFIKQVGILEPNAWIYIFGSEYRLCKNRFFKFLKIPKAILSYIYLYASNQFYTDTLLAVFTKES